MTIDIQGLKFIGEASETELAHIRSRLQTARPSFVSDENLIAALAFGGTVQSAYDPSLETIKPVAMNPALERTQELAERFGVAGRNMTGAILVAKDSRDIVDADMIMLVHVIREIKNRKIFVSCGTYMLPDITQVLEDNFGQGKSDKIIGVTGSNLPLALEGQDADFNIGGTIAAINALALAGKKGMVFAQYHGEVFEGENIATLNIHPPNFRPRFGRPSVDVR